MILMYGWRGESPGIGTYPRKGGRTEKEDGNCVNLLM